jgi:hypothetical protein
MLRLQRCRVGRDRQHVVVRELSTTGFISAIAAPLRSPFCMFQS